jgi:Flp pilus assembly protein TadG
MAGQRGQAIVLVAVMLGVVVGMAALAIDGSRAYATRRDLQAAVDAAALAAGDNLQRTGSYTSAEQAATTSFGTNLRLYSTPSCSPGYGTPGASSVTITCTFSDGTTLTQVVTSQGPRGGLFTLTGARTVQLQFGRILTNGSDPGVAALAGGRVNNLLYAPAVGALGQAGCGGAAGSAITINGSGTLSVTGDVVASGAVSISAGALRVAGDVYARCQSSVSGVSSACYPSGASTPCTFPDVAGAVRSGYHYVDPGYPAPAVVGGSQGIPSANVVLSPGAYAANPSFSGGDCYFLSGGVYEWLGGFTNSSDFVSNELKPPDEPMPGSNTTLASRQFWNTNGVNCAGSYRAVSTGVSHSLTAGNWGVELTSTRTDAYGGTSYSRESAPSVCRVVDIDAGYGIQVQVSNVPGATAYNVYLSPPPGACNGPFGFAGTVPVTGTVSNAHPSSCPVYTGTGCSLGNEQITLDSVLVGAGFAPNSLAAPDTPGAYPPNSERAPLAANLPNQNPARGAGAAGDRANENNCETTGGAFATCPNAVTPGAVEFYLPSPSCLNNTNTGDTYVFSGYQYDWVSMYEPAANGCANTLGAASNTALVGLVYTPGASMTVSSPFTFEVAATGGLIAGTVTFNGTLPSITYGAAYAPVPFAARLVS